MAAAGARCGVSGPGARASLGLWGRPPPPPPPPHQARHALHAAARAPRWQPCAPPARPPHTCRPCRRWRRCWCCARPPCRVCVQWLGGGGGREGRRGRKTTRGERCARGGHRPACCAPAERAHAGAVACQSVTPKGGQRRGKVQGRQCQAQRGVFENACASTACAAASASSACHSSGTSSSAHTPRLHAHTQVTELALRAGGGHRGSPRL